jgi:hypothetical protein
MEVLSSSLEYLSFDDGARVSWVEHMRCTCLTARRQVATKVCCKHTVYAIRTRADYLAEKLWHTIPVVLTDEDGASAWVKVQRINNKLYAALQGASVGLIGSEVTCRIDARNLVIPYLLGLSNCVPCTECTGNETWIESQVIRRVCFWLENPNSGVCVYHSLDDLIPTF